MCDRFTNYTTVEETDSGYLFNAHMNPLWSALILVCLDPTKLAINLGILKIPGSYISWYYVVQFGRCVKGFRWNLLHLFFTLKISYLHMREHGVKLPEDEHYQSPLCELQVWYLSLSSYFAVNTDESIYIDIGLCDTSSITSDILLCQLIPHC